MVAEQILFGITLLIWAVNPFRISGTIKGLCIYTVLFVVITSLLRHYYVIITSLLRSYYVVSITNGVRSILVST